MQKWKELVYQHLSEYKKEDLKTSSNGIWSRNKRKYPHILPYENKNLNLIKSKYYDASMKWSIENKNSLHPGFHHLNSSQALAINLFVPFIEERLLNTLLQSFGVEEEIVTTEFEHVENKIEGTNFDFFIQGKKNKYFFEVKYTEDRFGYASGDLKHKIKFEEIYLPKLKSICKIEMKEFLKDYQLWRNISYLNDGFVIFTFPKFRKDLAQIVNSALLKINSNDRVKIIFIEDILIKFKDSFKQEQEHFKIFEKKYLNISGI